MYAKTLLDILQEEKATKFPGGIYHNTQIDFTYNSNNMEGSRLTHDQTIYMFETNSIGMEKGALNVDDLIETVNHFRCIDQVIDYAKSKLSEKFIKMYWLMYNSTNGEEYDNWYRRYQK